MSRPWTRRRFVTNGATSIVAACGLARTTSASQATEGEKGFQGRFAICNETFGDWPFPRAFELAAECGYQGIEIAPFTISDYVTDIGAGRRREIRGQAEKVGLEVVALHWLLARTKGFHLTSPDRQVQRNTAAYLGALAQFCADLGGKMLVLGSPKQRDLAPGLSIEEGMRHAAAVLAETLPVLEKTDVRLALEPLAPTTTNFLRTAEEAVQLVKMVDSPRCRLILDCNAMASESQAPAELIRQYGSYLVHLHANDPNDQGPGFGELDFVPIFKALREIKYRGWVSVEVFDYAPGPERLARESIQYMKRCITTSG